MPLYNVEAIVIKSKNTGEADKIITLFSRTHGKIRAIAKGARRPTSKFGGRLEIFTYNKILLATARTLDIISQCETLESFYKLREAKDELNAGTYILKLVDIVTEERQRNDELFALLLDAQYALHRNRKPDIVARGFEVKLCDIEGLLPTDKMLERKYEKLPYIVSLLKGAFEDRDKNLTDRDLEISGKIFRELISDHAGKDLRGLKAVI